MSTIDVDMFFRGCIAVGNVSFNLLRMLDPGMRC